MKGGKHPHLLRWFSHIESLPTTQEALTALAEHTGTGIAFAVAGAFSVLGALCYLPAWRAERAADAG